MKRLVCALLLFVSGAAMADDLADADRFLKAKEYDKAFSIYTRLAQAGNSQAQLRVGEMYWFGEGRAPDLKKAEIWLEKSSAAGNADGAASLAGLKRRETRAADIVYWTSTYAGQDLTAGEFACKAPELPEVSRTKKEIIATQRAIEAWHACYSGFVTNINAALPAGKRIPADVVDMMTPAEGRQAQRHLDAVYTALIERSRREAAAFVARENAWGKATEAFVQREVTANKRTEIRFAAAPNEYAYARQARVDLTPAAQASSRATR